MLKDLFSKKTKSMVALATIATLLMTTAGPTFAADLQMNDSNLERVAGATTKYRNVMYYGDWSIWGGQKQFYPKDIPADQLTHLNFSFLDFDANGVLQFIDKDAAVTNGLGDSSVFAGDANSGILPAFEELKNVNPNLKIGVSLGGWSKGGDFSVIAASPQKRAVFVANVLEFIKYNNMDFVDIDWEYPTAKRDPDLCDNSRDEGTVNGTPADKENFILLLQDFRAALEKQGKLLGKTYELTVALPAPIAKVESGIDVKKLFALVDFANIMTYDMRGAWDPISGHQAALYTNPNDPYKGKGLSIEESVNYYMAQGAPSDKIVIGAAYYTRGWEKVKNDGTDKNNPGLFGTAEVVTKDADGTPSTGANPEIPIKNGEGGRMTGVWSYNALEDLKKKYTGLKEYWDDVVKSPYLYNETTGAFFTYDNVRSIQEKVKFVKEKNLGGMIAWMASMDKATTTSKRDELTKATKDALYGSALLPKYEVTHTKYNYSANVAITKPTMGVGTAAIKLTVNNNEVVKGTGEVLGTVEANAKTIKNGKLYIETDGVKIVGAEYPLVNSNIKEENGYYVIDLAETYDGKMITPGKSKSYVLIIDAPIENLDGIVSVGLSQRMYKSSQEFEKRNIYGRDSEQEIVDANGNYLPTIAGVRNKKIGLGDEFYRLDGITAKDKEDGDLTSKIEVSGSINTRVTGNYELTYSVTDSKGAKRVAKATITVTKKTRPLPDNYDAKKTYDNGQFVIYNGIKYQCVWYSITNITPGTNEVIWKTIGKAEEEIAPEPLTLETVAGKYNVKRGSTAWNGKCDVNADGIVDLFDLTIVGKLMN